MKSDYFYDIAEEMSCCKYISKLNKNVLFIYSPTSLKKTNINNNKMIMKNWHDISKNIEKIEDYIEELNNIDEIVTLGGGSTVDIGKYISYRLNIRYTCIPSMLSTNSYATNKVALIKDGKKTTIEAKMPERIIIDNELLKLSKSQNLYGLADVLSIYTALYDWKIANTDINEDIDINIYEMAENLLVDVLNFIQENTLEDIINRNMELFKYIGIAGYITNLYGTGRPESGSEHIMAKEIEKNIDVPHGMSVSVGILSMGLMQNRNIKDILKAINKLKVFDKADQYGLTKKIIEKSFFELEPREDRYTIIDRYVQKIKYKEKIINKLFKIMEKGIRNMLIINDFFVRYKEAVSNQMELISKYNNGKIISATRFMGQQALQEKDIKDNIYVYSPIRYFFETIKCVLKNKNENIHVFEEEPCWWKRVLFNKGKNPIYISMYRRPTTEYAEHLKKYKNLKKVFVELPYHKQILVDNGVDKSKIEVTPTPSKIPRRRSAKKYNPNSVNILFASWNNKEGDAIRERGLQFLLELLKANPNFTLTIPLRDNDTKNFKNLAKKLDVTDRISLLDIHNNTETLIELFDDSDFVAFVPQKRIVKDVPNSLIDGLVRGKPVIISDVIDFSREVCKNNIGIVVHGGDKPAEMNINEEIYKALSQKAYEYSKIHSPENYLKIIETAYYEKQNLEKNQFTR